MSQNRAERRRTQKAKAHPVFLVLPVGAGGNFLPRVLKLAAALRPGTVTDIRIEHDGWCDYLAGKGPCNCDPCIRGKDLTGPTPADLN